MIPIWASVSLVFKMGPISRQQIWLYIYLYTVHKSLKSVQSPKLNLDFPNRNLIQTEEIERVTIVPGFRDAPKMGIFQRKKPPSPEREGGPWGGQTKKGRLVGFKDPVKKKEEKIEKLENPAPNCKDHRKVSGKTVALQGRHFTEVAWKWRQRKTDSPQFTTNRSASQVMT